MNAFIEFVGGLKERHSSVLISIKDLGIDKKRLVGSCGAIAVGIILSRCGIMDTIYPFGQGYFICMLLYSSYYKAAAIGCFIGWLSLLPSIPFSGMFATASSISILALANRYFKVEQSRLLKTAYIFFSIISIFIFNMGTRYFMLVGVFEATIGIVSLFIYDKAARALFVHKKRSRLTDDEAICVVFCLCTLVIFTGEMKVGAFELSTILAGILTIGFGYIFDSTVGAATGVLCGLCVSIGGGSLYTIGSMGVCGFFAGLPKKYGRVASVAAYIVANAVLTLYINGSSFVILPIQNTLASGAALILFPKKYMDMISGLLCATLSRSKEERYYIEKYNGLAKEKLDNLAGLFKTISELFFENSAVMQRPDVQISTIIKTAAEETCQGCIWHKKCWEDEFLSTYNAFQDLTESLLLDSEHINHINECVNKLGVEGAIKRAIESERKENKKKINKNEGNELLSKQFEGVSSLLSNMNSEIKNDIKFESDIEKNIRDELLLFDVNVCDVCVMNIAGAYRCEVTIDGCGDNLGCRHKVERAVSKFCGKPMVLTDNIRQQRHKCTLKYTAARPLKVNVFMAQEAKEALCGDSYKIGYVSDNKYMLCISDGMGSGKTAKEESNACVNLLYGFYKAGFDDNVIFETVNKLLMLKSDTEIFTTADICMIDVVRSKACFTKIGAVPSVIIKEGKAIAINGESLPMGILDEINERSFEIDIEDGDILIMFTDGVYDALCSEEIKIEKVIMDIAGDCRDIRALTSGILERCKHKNNGENKDDMTILISMFKKEKSC